jgi:hypothetical protein
VVEVALEEAFDVPLVPPLVDETASWARETCGHAEIQVKMSAISSWRLINGARAEPRLTQQTRNRFMVTTSSEILVIFFALDCVGIRGRTVLPAPEVIFVNFIEID